MTGGTGRAIADLPPTSFAMVMATGIVAIAAHRAGLGPVAAALFAIDLVAYALLAALTALRLARYPGRVARDLVDPLRGPGFLTTVAATGVLGAALERLTGASGIALGLWLVAAALWVGLTYGFLTAVMVGGKPGLAAALSGSWLMLVVATESLSVLGALVADRVPGWRPAVLAAALGAHLLGAMLYLLIIPLIFYRLAFLPLEPRALTPPYWINMGALAITALAGATLVGKAAEAPLLGGLAPVLTGLTLLAWVTATWWTPLLAALGAWRHLVRRVPLAYEAAYWSLVFPLGMYATATFQFATAVRVDGLTAVARAATWIALLAWAATFWGLLRYLAGPRRPLLEPG